MEFGFTEEQEKLRKEIYEFFMNELPSDFDPAYQSSNKETQDFYRQLVKKAVAKGYYVPGWPKEYGGSGFTDMEQGILGEVMGSAGVGWPDSLGLHLLGPTLILIGTEEQKKRFLPPIARGDTICFEAFTEPEAGSDEANIRTRAVENGGHYVVNGQKVFISGSHKPDWLFTLVRTEDTIPKHRGITLFMIPADLPGITFRPLPTMGGGMQNEVFFDDVKIAKDYMLGQKNRGFYAAMQVFEFERAMTAGGTRGRRSLEELIQFCRERKRNGRALIEYPEVRTMLAELAIENEALKLAGWYTTWAFSERKRLGAPKWNTGNYYAKKYAASRAKMEVDILGLYGQLRTGSKYSDEAYEGRLERAWRSSRSTHAGGTFEVMKIVLAQRGLGLPRIPGRLMAEIGKALREA